MHRQGSLQVPCRGPSRGGLYSVFAEVERLSPLAARIPPQASHMRCKRATQEPPLPSGNDSEAFRGAGEGAARARAVIDATLTGVDLFEGQITAVDGVL